MKKRILVITSAVVLTALVAVPFAFAQRMRGQGFAGPMFLEHLQHVKQQLGLSDQQVTDIKAIFQDLRQQNQQYRQSMRGTMQQVAQTLLNNPNDIAAAQSLLDQQAATQHTLQTNTLNAMSKALNVLTPDQRTKLSTMLQQRMQRTQK